MAKNYNGMMSENDFNETVTADEKAECEKNGTVSVKKPLAYKIGTAASLPVGAAVVGTAGIMGFAKKTDRKLLYSVDMLVVEAASVLEDMLHAGPRRIDPRLQGMIDPKISAAAGVQQRQGGPQPGF